METIQSPSGFVEGSHEGCPYGDFVIRNGTDRPRGRKCDWIVVRS